VAEGDWIDRLCLELLGEANYREDEVFTDLTPRELRAMIQEHVGAGVMEILAERQRVIEVEGFDAEHDRHYRKGELERAAAAYAYAASIETVVAENRVQVLTGAPGPRHAKIWPTIVTLWPWSLEWWKPKRYPRRDLVRAGQLILAALDRQDAGGVA
jgi:hypothetical protein